MRTLKNQNTRILIEVIIPLTKAKFEIHLSGSEEAPLPKFLEGNPVNEEQFKN